ncbi:MAG: hypothetical protein D6735_11060, partial [Acidobacteria bacterium]
MTAKTRKPYEEEQNTVDFTQKESHAQVQCEDIRLILSSLKPLSVDKSRDTSTRFAFRVHVVIEGNKAYG